MKEQIKTPEKELSNEEIANLSDADEYGPKIKEEMKAIQSEIKEIYREPTVKGRKPGLKAMIWNKRRK